MKEFTLSEKDMRKFQATMQRNLPKSVFHCCCPNLENCKTNAEIKLMPCIKGKEWIDWNLSENLESPPPYLTCERFQEKNL